MNNINKVVYAPETIEGINEVLNSDIINTRLECDLIVNCESEKVSIQLDGGAIEILKAYFKSKI